VASEPVPYHRAEDIASASWLMQASGPTELDVNPVRTHASETFASRPRCPSGSGTAASTSCAGLWPDIRVFIAYRTLASPTGNGPP